MSEMDLRGGQHFSNKSEIQKSLEYPIGGGGQAYLGHRPKFSHFLIMTPPLSQTILGGIFEFHWNLGGSVILIED